MIRIVLFYKNLIMCHNSRKKNSSIYKDFECMWELWIKIQEKVQPKLVFEASEDEARPESVITI